METSDWFRVVFHIFTSLAESESVLTPACTEHINQANSQEVWIQVKAVIPLISQIKSSLITSRLTEGERRQVWIFKPWKRHRYSLESETVARAYVWGEKNPELWWGVCQKHQRSLVFLQGRSCHIDEEETFDNVCCEGLWQPAVVRCDRQ